MAESKSASSLSVLMVHPHDLHSPQEPWTVRIRSLAEELVKRGHRVVLAYHKLGRGWVEHRESLSGVELIELKRNIGALARNTRALTREARRCDIVHLQKCIPHAAISTLWAAYLTGRPIHYDWDDWEYKIQEIETGGKAPAWLQWIETKLPSLFDTVSVASEELKRLALAAGVGADKVFDAPVGADLELFSPSVSGHRVREHLGVTGPLVMYLGQLHAAQYVGQFLEAGTRLLERLPETTLVVVGSGWRLPELKDKARVLGLEDRVIFTGAVPYGEVPQYLAAADVVVACFEDNEATRAKSPLKVVEYLAAGKAIVASAVGEVERMVASCGVLVPAGDIMALSDAVHDLLLDEDRRRELGRKSREKAERVHSWAAVAQNLERAYRRALTREP
jgi:glycosyltransferase involved in cell wall biosynthesis